MLHILYEPADEHPIAILIRPSSMKKWEIERHYLTYLKTQKGIDLDQFIVFSANYNEHNKAPVKFIREYLEDLMPAMHDIGVKFIYVADPAYFKVLTKQTKTEPHHGYVMPCALKGYEHMQVVLGMNYQALVYNPELRDKMDLGLEALASAVHGNYVALGTGIIHSAQYPTSYQEIAQALESLHQYSELTCDVETFSLRFNEAGIGTIGFAWDQHNGLAFACDYDAQFLEDGYQVSEGFSLINLEVRRSLKNFLETYKGTITWHNAAFDVKCIIYALWMDDPLDTEGLLEGLEVMTRSVDDTRIIAYLATNTTAGNVLGLKPLAHEFAGNWAVEEIKDIRKVPLKDLLQYNLVDCLSTWYVKNKYTPMMIRDRQEELYKSLMLPSLKLIIQLELTGMPMDPNEIQVAKALLEEMQNKHLQVIRKSPVIKMLNLLLQTSAMEAANAKLKVKQHPLDKFSDVEFNPNSGPQLQRLLYEQMCLPVIDLTDTKQPATGGKVIEKLINHTDDPGYKAVLASLIEYTKVTTILNTFISSFERGLVKADGMQYLHGSFNLGGAVSGRLSSSDPNMQNIPAGAQLARYIKECFVSPKGWLMVGADFNSLEDMISALTTKDSNKLKTYTDGYDGHSLRAFTYFRDQMPDIEDTLESINTIPDKYPDLRQDSKPGTFLLTYGGTYHGLMNNLGWSETKAKAIEAGYHELYKESDAYVQTRLKQATHDGYVEVAFGLRVRTPLLEQVVWDSGRIPYEASAEGRTAGNALGQSYGLLNNRAAVAFMKKVWASKYRYCIKPIALIHDAIYLLIKDDIEVVEWVNNNLIKEMQWQELPELHHPTVKLGAELDIFWPSWNNGITIPNNADQITIRNICDKAMNKLKEAA